jgi:glycosyltransferase involved in cell wall biosynthesis
MKAFMNRDRINIAYIIDEIPSPNGGTEGQLLTLIKGLNRDRFAPHLVCLRGSEWLDNCRLDVPILVLNVSRLASLRAVAGAFKLRAFCRQNAIDIAQTFFIDSNIYGVIAAKVAGCRAIVSSRRNAGYGYTKWHLRILRSLRGWIDYYLVNSAMVGGMTAETEFVSPEKIKLIYNGLDLEKFRAISPALRRDQRAQWGIKQDEILVGLTANLRDVKNIDFLIAAASNLCREFANLRFVVVGEGPDREKLQELITKLDLSSRFLLAGRYAEVLPCLAAFDIAVLCSKSESFSNSLIEYMAAGLPIVASDVGGNSEAIKSESTGLLYKSGDMEEFQNHIRRIIKNPELAEKIGREAKNDAFAKYEARRSIRAHEEFYLELMEKAAQK